jgi:hypothetical protein
MKLIYKLQIRFAPGVETYDSITGLLNTKPTENKYFKNFSDKIPLWLYEVSQSEKDPY